MTDDVFERVKPNRRREWTVFLALLVVVFGAYFKIMYFSKSKPLSSQSAHGRNWFLALRLPELSTSSIATSAGKDRLSEWLAALLSAGYHPVSFSQALAGISGNASLPDKAVVLIYEPGYRTTYQSLAPVLARQRIPAALITNGSEVDNTNVRFLSKHQLGIMQNSGLWDVGYFRDSTMTFTLAGKSYSWGPDVGRYVLNGRQDLGALNLLNVNLAWTGPQLLDIIRAMAPIQESCLTTGFLLGSKVGIVKAASACGAGDSFALEATPDSHSASMFWRGASSVKDFSLLLEADSVVDELLLYLRYDARKRRGLLINFTPKMVGVMELRGEIKKRLAMHPWSYTGGQFVSSLTLSNRRLELAVGNGTSTSIELPDTDSFSGNNIMIIVYSKLRGVAQAKSTRLLLTPL